MWNFSPLRFVSLVSLLSVAACGDSGGSGSADAGDLDADPPLDALDAPPDSAELDVVDAAEADTAEPDGADADVEGGGTIGDPCAEDADCDSGVCISLASGDVPGLCTDLCNDSSSCPEGFDCLLITNSGSDAINVCIPRDYCADGDGDRFGVGPGCLGRDCDDTNEDVNFAADEFCDGIDNDCDEQIDENPIDVGDDCATGYPGLCGPGRLICEAANVVCRGNIVPTDEVCDGVDNDCNELVDDGPADLRTWYRDFDNDRYGDPDTSVVACDAPEGYVATADDCDDERDDVNPTAPEVCDGVDNDCNDLIDDEPVDLQTWYLDLDNDRFGDPDTSEVACDAPEGYIATADDCDDERDDVNPAEDEVCDGVDNDCDEQNDIDAVDAPLWYLDSDGDGSGAGEALAACTAPENYVANNTDCDDDNELVGPSAIEVCDGVDNNCADGIDENSAVDAATWYLDFDADTWGAAATSLVACAQPETYVANAEDCDDSNADVNPAADEQCNGVDDNCRDGIDEGVTADGTTWYLDGDSDFYGRADSTVVRCVQPVGYAAVAGDCDDSNLAVNPGAFELCNGVDDNCADGIDEGSPANATAFYLDSDNDQYGQTAVVVRLCARPAGYAPTPGDCNDGNSAINPIAAEVCNGVDDNCRDGIDEGVLGSFFRDADGDGWGNAGDVVVACANPGGRVTTPGDCDDTNPRRNPGLAERCDGIDNNCDGFSTQIDRRGRIVEYDAACQNFGGGNANDLCFGESWNGQGYMHCHYHASFDAARGICQARGMELADMNSAEENDAVIGAFNGQDGESWDDLWIGGRESGNTRHFSWVRTGVSFWQNGAVGLYANWRSGEPSNDSGGGNDDCTAVRQSGFNWNDRNCGGSIEFICEW